MKKFVHKMANKSRKSNETTITSPINGKAFINEFTAIFNP